MGQVHGPYPRLSAHNQIRALPTLHRARLSPLPLHIWTGPGCSPTPSAHRDEDHWLDPARGWTMGTIHPAHRAIRLSATAPAVSDRSRGSVPSP